MLFSIEWLYLWQTHSTLDIGESIFDWLIDWLLIGSVFYEWYNWINKCCKVRELLGDKWCYHYFLFVEDCLLSMRNPHWDRLQWMICLLEGMTFNFNIQRFCVFYLCIYYTLIQKTEIFLFYTFTWMHLMLVGVVCSRSGRRQLQNVVTCYIYSSE